MEEHDSQIDAFIGWKSEDGQLEVIGVYGKKCNNKVFKVTCTECSKDSELFPDGYFVSTKQHLKTGAKPCGCSKYPKWKAWQYLILVRRIGEKKGFIVHGFSEKFKGSTTKLNLECLKDGYKWSARINDVINKGSGCPKCRDRYVSNKNRTPINTALQNCVDICKEMGYEFIGFTEGYRNSNSPFEYICKIHGKQEVSYNHFIYSASRCNECWKDKQKALGNLYGYYPERKDEQDFLYVLNFNNKFIKVGRSFDVKIRISKLKQKSKIKNIKKLYILTGTHQEIYDLEQELHNELRERGFSYNVDWSTECFDNNSLDFIKYFIQKSGVKTIG